MKTNEIIKRLLKELNKYTTSPNPGCKCEICTLIREARRLIRKPRKKTKKHAELFPMDGGGNPYGYGH